MTIFKRMVNDKSHGKKRGKFQHGGARHGAGRRPKIEGAKTKVSVSIDTGVFTKAKTRWGDAFSNLVEMLLDQYATNPVN